MNSPGDIAAARNADNGMRIRGSMLLATRTVCLSASDIETGIDAMTTGRKESPLLYAERGNNTSLDGTIGQVQAGAPILITTLPAESGEGYEK